MTHTDSAVHWAGWFHDPELEDRFQQATFADTLIRARNGTAMIVVLTVATILVDWLTRPETGLVLLPNRLLVMAGGLMFVGPLTPTSLPRLWVRAALLFNLYATGLAHQHVYRQDAAGLVLVWITMVLFGTSVWRLVPARWLSLTHAYSIGVMLTAGMALGQHETLFQFELFSTLTIAVAFVWWGMQQDRSERTQRLETWRAEGLAESREAVLAAVAHELRTPLAVARMAVAVAQKVPERSLPLLERIDRRLVGLSELVDAVLRLGSLDEIRTVHQVDLAGLMREIVDDQRALHPHLELEVQGEAIIAGDPALWHSALMNLVQNGVRFARKRLLCRIDDGRLTVEDDGAGVPEKDRKRIFEPMVRLAEGRGDHPGHGMGLSLTRRILNAHGAEISVDDSPLGGARFEITW